MASDEVRSAGGIRRGRERSVAALCRSLVGDRHLGEVAARLGTDSRSCLRRGGCEREQVGLLELGELDPGSTFHLVAGRGGSS
jgi:hypothetical protein